jgi:hypothetical protein
MSKLVEAAARAILKTPEGATFLFEAEIPELTAEHLAQAAILAFLEAALEDDPRELNSITTAEYVILDLIQQVSS